MRDNRGKVEGSKGTLRHRPRVEDSVQILGLGPGWWWQTSRGEIQAITEAGSRDDNRKEAG